MFVCTGADRSDGKSDRSVGGGRARKGENQRTEGGVGHMRMPADDFRLTCRSKGRAGGKKGLITPTKVVTCDTLSSAVCLDLRVRSDLLYPSILHRIFSFKFSFDSVLTFEATGVDAF